MKSKKKLLGLCILLFIILCGFIYCIRTKEPDPHVILTETESSDSFSDAKNTEEEKEDISSDSVSEELPEETIGVYVCGEVASPGVYYLGSEARICDAVELAGGFTCEADTSAVNLASHLTDGMKIFIPRPGDNITEDIASSSGVVSDGKININSAGESDLTTIPGIGPAKAKQIIEYREEHGRFAQISDIMNISGIKEATYNKIKNYITV